MDQFEKVEKLKERANVTYEEAKQALEASEWDILEAMIYLEKQGKAIGAAKVGYAAERNESGQTNQEKASQTGRKEERTEKRKSERTTQGDVHCKTDQLDPSGGYGGNLSGNGSVSHGVVLLYFPLWHGCAANGGVFL